MTIELPETALAAIRRAAASGPRRLELRVVGAGPPPSLGSRLVELAREVERQSGGAVPATIDVASPPDAMPTLVVRAGSRDVVRYHAVPVGPEKEPFVEALLACSGALTPEIVELPPVPPSQLTVFIAASCPNCPVTVRAAVTLAALVDQLDVTFVDVAEFPEWASRVGVRSVPTTVTSDGLTIVGALSAAELARRLSAGGGPERDRLLLRSQLDAGRFAAAGELLASGRAHAEFVERWRDSGMEGRIGLTLSAEEALRRSRGALDAIVPGLAVLLSSGESPVRGDTADLLGRIGHPSARAALEVLAGDADEDVAEAATDALAAIDARARDAP